MPFSTSMSARSCAGGHQLSNGHTLGCGLQRPSSLGFTQVSETDLVPGVTGLRFAVSPAGGSTAVAGVRVH